MTFPVGSSQDCFRAWDAMPWVLQGSAPREQDEWLENHMAHCESCRVEFEQQKRLRLAMSLPTDIPVDADAGLKRLIARLDAPDLAEMTPRHHPGRWLARALVAAVLVQAIGIGILGVRLSSTDNGAAYRTLSQESVPAPLGSIRVVPDAAMTLAGWDALLHSLRLRVVNGPNDVGAYTVVPEGPPSSSSTQSALQRLRATRGIRFAEPVVDSP